MSEGKTLEERIKSPVRDSQTLPMFDKVKVKYPGNATKPNNSNMPVESDTPSKSLPEIALFSHHNFNMLQFPPGPGDGEYGGEPLVSLRTTFDVDLSGHLLSEGPERPSSAIVYSGKWNMYAGDTLLITLGPGQYKELSELGIANDTITRIESVME